MSESATSCLVCHAELSDLRVGSGATVCPECGLVQSENEEALASVFAVEHNATTEVNGEIGPNDWFVDFVPKDSSEHRLVETLRLMDTVAEELSVHPQVRIQAAELTADVWERRFMHGRSLDATVGAIIYLACRESGSPRPMNSVAEALNIRDSNFHSTYCSLAEELGVRRRVVTPTEYLSFLGGQLSLSDEVTLKAATILNDRREISGNPAGVAVAALYIAADVFGEKITYQEAGQIAGVTKETVWRKATEIRNQQSSSD